MFTVYILRAASTPPRSYVGITTNLERRVAQHNGRLRGGAKATRGGRPWTVVFSTPARYTRGGALSLEARTKQRRGVAARASYLRDASS